MMQGGRLKSMSGYPCLGLIQSGVSEWTKDRVRVMAIEVNFRIKLFTLKLGDMC